MGFFSDDPRAVPTLDPDVNEKIRELERVVLTRIIVLKGRGVEEDPFREVRYWYDDSGRLIAQHDSWRDCEHQKED